MYTKHTLIILTCLLLAAGYSACSSSNAASPDATESIMLTGVPDVRQAEYYSCGAASFQAVLSYYGTDSFETDIRKLLNTSATHGTYSWDMVSAATQMGYDASWGENFTLDDIAAALRLGTPVITRSQRLKDTDGTWDSTWGVGHYMVVFGLDSQNVYLEDPFLLNAKLVMTRDDFVASWHSYVEEVPIPPDATKHYHEAVFIRGTPPTSRPEFIGPLEIPPVVPIVLDGNS